VSWVKISRQRSKKLQFSTNSCNFFDRGDCGCLKIKCHTCVESITRNDICHVYTIQMPQPTAYVCTVLSTFVCNFNSAMFFSFRKYDLLSWPATFGKNSAKFQGEIYSYFLWNFWGKFANSQYERYNVTESSTGAELLRFRLTIRVRLKRVVGESSFERFGITVGQRTQRWSCRTAVVTEPIHGQLQAGYTKPTSYLDKTHGYCASHTCNETKTQQNTTRIPADARKDALQPIHNFLLQCWPSRSSTVDEFYLIWKGISILMINSNLGPISHRLATIHP